MGREEEASRETGEGGGGRERKLLFNAQCTMPVLYLLMGLNVHSNLFRLIRDEGKWGGVPMSYHLLATLSPQE